MDIKVGDKITVEFEVTTGPSCGQVATKPVGGSSIWTNYFTVDELPKIVQKHTPKPIELAAGQVWSDMAGTNRKIVFSDDQTTVYDRQEVVGMRRCTCIPKIFLESYAKKLLS